MKLAVSFPFGLIGEVGQNEFYKQMYSAITEIIKEEDVSGIQVYPAQWPRKVLITLKDPTCKEALLLSGINIKGQHIDLIDESLETIKITVKDALIEWSKDKIIEVLKPYGEVKKVENELIFIDGKPTSWLTGTRFVYMTKIDRVIPNRLSTFDGDKEVTVSVWYRRPYERSDKCYKCGGQHDPLKCTFSKKVCFKCKGDHIFKDCPQNDGSRVGENVFVFMTEKSPLSNFNKKYPIQIDGTTYNCNEQFIQSQKAELFGDNRAKDRIMASDNPREMKDLGKRIRGYVDSEWKEATENVISECIRRKVYDHQEVQDYLMTTNDKIIGEGTSDPHFGIGLHISDSRVLNYNEWQGHNLMGKALMEVRSEIKLLQGVRAEIHSIADVDDAMAFSTPCEVFRSRGHDSMVVSPIPDCPSNQCNLPNLCEQNDYDKLIPDAAKNKNCAILFGDSNARGIDIDNPDYKVTKVCKAGARIQDLSDLMENCTTNPKDVNAVLLQLGTCNWSAKNTDGIETSDSLYREFVEALNSASSKYPYAELLVSSVPKRLPQSSDDTHISAINTEVAALNKSLKLLANTEDNIAFIDNDIQLTNNGLPDKSLYVKTDTSGVHLNTSGLALVSGNMAKGLSELFFNTSDDGQWQTK